MKKYLLTLVLGSGFIVALGQQYYQTDKIVDEPVNQRTQQRSLGTSVAISNTHILAGHSGLPLRQLVFGDPRISPAWLAPLTSNGRFGTQQPLDRNRPSYIYSTGFGLSVALSDDYAVIGEPHYFEENTSQVSSDGYGAAVVYENSSGWGFKQRLQSNDIAKHDYFGSEVEVAGNQIVVGTNVNSALSPRNPNHGGVYIFEKNGSGNWEQIQKLTPDVTKQFTHLYAFGQKIDVSGDYMIISAYVKAYIFKRIAGVWQQMQVIEITAANESKIISDVSIAGGYACISSISSQRNQNGTNQLFEAGAAYMFEKDGAETWSYTQKLVHADRLEYHSFGTSVAQFDNRLVVGATGVKTDHLGGNSYDVAGAAYIFERDGNAVWQQVQKITPNDRAANDRFGIAVDMQSDKVIVGAPWVSTDEFGRPSSNYYLMGAAYVFKRISLPSLPVSTATASLAAGRVSEVLLLSDSNEPILTLGITGAKNLFGNYTEAKVWKQAAEQSLAGKLYLARNYQITPTNNINTSTATVTLYFNQQEFLDFNANPAKTADFPINAADLNGIANLRILKISSSSNDNSGLINTYSGTQLVINPDDDKIIWNATANRWEVTFDVVGFSGFFATTEPTTLPVTLVDFSVKKESNGAKLQWQTATETNNKAFEIYRSGDDKQFIKIDEVDGKGSNSLYAFFDKKPLNGNNYYKLVQVDIDGKPTELGERALNFELSAAGLQIYPNPTAGEVTLSFSAGKYQKVSVIGVDGKVLNTSSVLPNQTQIRLDLSAYAGGFYFVQLSGTDGVETQKLIKN